MKLTRPRIITIGVAAAVLAISLTSMASGVSLSKLVKKEVSKQISKATGPAGATGATGAPGSAVAFGHITYTSDTPTANPARSSGITGVSETTTGAIAGTDGFVCLDVAVPVKTAVATSIYDNGVAPRDIAVWIPASPPPAFSLACPVASDVLVMISNGNGAGTFALGSFTIALY